MRRPPGAQARRDAVELALRRKCHGDSWARIAGRLGISARSLYAWRRGGLARRSVGRPLGTLDPEAKEVVDDLLRNVGPDIGAPTLRAFLPVPSRRPLERHLRQYRQSHRRRRRARLYRLTWRRPGAVWAVDLADPLEPLEGGEKAVLAVRDLASRCTIAWTPLPRGSAAEVAALLERLLRRHGAPLVLKSDNGSCFVAAEVADVLTRFGAIHLRSPRAWPQYNGACEAGIGLLRTYTDSAAASRGGPPGWTIDDLEAARARANDLVRRRGDTRETADVLWRKRMQVALRERRRFQARLRLRLRELGSVPPRRRARLRRMSIQQALVDLGYLDVRRAWVRARSTGPGAGPTYR